MSIVCLRDERFVLPPGTVPLDAIDRKILAVLQDDASLSVAEIGNRVGLFVDAPAWKADPAASRADGVIQKRVAIIDQDKLGPRRHGSFVSVETEDHSGRMADQFSPQLVGRDGRRVLEFYPAWPATSTTCCASWFPTLRGMTHSTSG